MASIYDSDLPRLTIRLPNWVGDVVMAVPTIQQLQNCSFVLRLVGHSWTKGLLEGMNLPITPIPNGIMAASRVMRTIKMNHGLLFTNSLSSALSMRLAGIRAVGYRTDWRRFLLHATLEKSLGEQHEVEYFWQLGKLATECWGLPGTTWPESPPRRIHLPLLNARYAAAAGALSATNIRGPYTVCCPLAVGTERGELKVWPHFAEFCQILASMGHTIVICPGPGEEVLCEPFQHFAKVLPRISLSVYAALMARAEMVVANDSGPMHIAAAVSAPVLGIFGISDPARTYPWGGQYVGSRDGWPDLDTVLSAWRKFARRAAGGKWLRDGNSLRGCRLSSRPKQRSLGKS